MEDEVKTEVKLEVKTEKPSVDDILTGAEKKQELPIPVNDEEPEYLEPAAEVSAEPEPESAAGDKDEYGNDVVAEKPKVYTEEEVNRMMRERFNREAARQQEQKPVQPKVEGSEDDGWESQLKNFVKETLVEVSQTEKQQKQVALEKQLQHEFEEKFVSGMKKYKDFETVVRGKPIDDVMMMATRSMKDPAAFLYAASKSFPKEIDRISQLSDPYAKIAEVGRLEERMRKVRAGTTAPRVLPKAQGDIENRQNHRGNVDDLILKDAQKKFSNRRY